MQESDVRHLLQGKLQPYGHLFPIENTAGVGAPDTSYCIQGRDGWIEIKYKAELPKRATTAALGECLRPAQRIWFNYHLKAGSRHCWLFARIADELIMLPGSKKECFEEGTVEQLREAAHWRAYTVRSASWDFLANKLTTGF